MVKDMQSPAGQPPVHPPEWPHSGIAGPIGELQQQVSLSGARTADDYMTGLSDVVHRNDEFLDLFGGTVWGRIVWTKDVGLPLSATLADAFVIVHKYQVIEAVVNPDGTVTNIGGWIDAATPKVWDGPHDDEHYRVSFMLHGASPWTNAIGIDLNRTVHWEPSTAPWLGPRVRYVMYPDSLQKTAGAFWPTRNGLTDFDDFHAFRWL